MDEDKVKQKSMEQATERDNEVQEDQNPHVKDFKLWRDSRMSAEDFVSMCRLAFSFCVLFDSSCMDISALIE